MDGIILGAKVHKPVYMGGKALGGEAQHPEHTGTIVYINHRGRFYTVEFNLPGGKLWESYKFDGR